MSSCLTDNELQAAADSAASPSQAAHLDACASCRQRLEERRAAIAAFGDLMEGTAVPPRLRARVMAGIAGADRASGATTIRPAESRRPWLRPLVLPIATVAAIALVVFAVLPRFGAPTEISASEVLGRSVLALGQVAGVERLEYDLRIEGLDPQLLVGGGDQSLTVRHIIDHDSGRFLVGKYAPDGTLAAGMAENPVAGIRTMVVHANGRRYVARLALPSERLLSIPQLARTMLRTWLGIVQASGSRGLTLARSPEGDRFIVQAPGLPADPGSAWNLEGARIVVDAQDYHIVELDTRGQMLGRQYHVSFMLRHREVGTQATDSDFEFKPEAGDVVLEGPASDNPIWDIGSAALRRLSAVAPTPAGSR